MFSKADACSWYDPDHEYFNLFTQSIIKDKTYLPFLHTFSNRFYGHEHFEIPNDNIETWQKYFNNALTYAETKTLVEKMPMTDLNAFKKGSSANAVLNKLGSYQKYSEGIDYLIEAKYLEPFMSIQYVESPNSFYYSVDENAKDATQLDYTKTINALKSLYNAAKNPEIKMRYGYQLVRFNHYTRRFDESTLAFKNYVTPLKTKSAPYFLALDQLAGAQRGLQQNAEANWNFFQVFMNSKNRKESAFVSMKLSDSASFNNILKRAQSPQEKNMAYFLLAYEDFSNPIPMMEKMYDIDPNSEILKVLAARSINELERSYLPVYFSAKDENGENTTVATQTTDKKSEQKAPEEISFWQKIKNFFSKIFSSDDDATKEGENASDKQLLNNPNRIPFYTKNSNLWTGETANNYLEDFEKFTKKTKEKSTDEFWQIADAYLSFLKKDYEQSSETLSKIKTTNTEYLAQIDRMKMLNDLVAEPKITPEYENHLLKTYPKIFAGLSGAEKRPFEYSEEPPSTQEFIRDILANRYFLQGEKGKSFLMSNKLSDLQYNPDSDLVKSVEDFYKKANKTELEKNIIAKNIDDVGNIDAFFNVLYGDREMRLANFEKAKSFYAKATAFSGIPRVEYVYNETDQPTVKKLEYGNYYNGFKAISSLVFGHNVWESYQSAEDQSMESENFTGFPFIKNEMNKLELSDALIQLKKIGMGTGEQSAQANQLIGNLMYNTSVLGYYRELFVMDVDNSNGGKYYFQSSAKPAFQYYYKNFTWTTAIAPDNFDLALQYYQKALSQSANPEQKARILFQMASAEQGKYYQYEANTNFDTDYNDPDWSKKRDAFDNALGKTKNDKYRTYFAELKKNYSQTATAKSLQGSCSYFDYFLRRN